MKSELVRIRFCTVVFVLFLCRTIHGKGLSLPIGDDQVPDPQVGRLCALGDVNKDRYTDLIVQRGIKLLFLLQSEDGKFKGSPRHGPIDLTSTKEVHCATGDFNGDAALDVLVATEISEGTYSASIFINHEGSFSELRLNQTFVEPPSVMDVNGDGISDALGLSTNASSVHSLTCIAGSRSVNFESCQHRFVPGDFSAGPYNRFPHIFVDIDGDLSSEIIFGLSDPKANLKFLTFRKENDYSWAIDNTTIPPLPVDPEYKYFAAPVISDFNADAVVDILIPVCREPSCTHVDRFLVWSSASRKWEQFLLDMKELSFVVEPNTSVVFRVGDFSLDGYPDLIATVVNRDNKTPLVLENVHSDNGNFSRKFEFNLQKDMHLILPEVIAGSNIITSAFFDLKEDGSLDILVEYKDKHTLATMLDFIRCDDKGDTTFLKVQLFTNVCANDCPATPSSDSGSGITWCGACVSYSMSTSYGAPRVSQQCQLPQTTYRTLHSPFILFGLGRSPNFVDEVILGSPRDPRFGANQRHVLKQIVPNSRVIVVPPERDDTHWQSRLYLTPSRLIIQSLLVQVTVCLILLALVVGLHMRERRHDRKERQAQSHRFHFDAM